MADFKNEKQIYTLHIKIIKFVNYSLKSINAYEVCNKCVKHGVLLKKCSAYKPAQYAGTARCIFENALYRYI